MSTVENEHDHVMDPEDIGKALYLELWEVIGDEFCAPCAVTAVANLLLEVLEVQGDPVVTAHVMSMLNLDAKDLLEEQTAPPQGSLH